MKQTKMCIVIVVLLLLVGSIVATSCVTLNKVKEEQKPFYIGVTYCGNSFQEAKELIDKVKDYTNIFIVPYHAFQGTDDIDEIGAYAIASNLKFAFSSSSTGAIYSKLFGDAKEKLGENFAGLYYQDELGGENA
ncbi:MAG: hypothetical protein LBC12_00820 [Nitrososphaerota archaeon]|jgi:hypothetical protein|nr:hypothetical protein [Nitrososphaerota archaeon]